MTTNTIEKVCPNCNAQPGRKCTQPTDSGRKEVSWFHLARERVDNTKCIGHNCDHLAPFEVILDGIPFAVCLVHFNHYRAQRKEFYDGPTAAE